MQGDPFSLDRLHDIVEPAPVSWLPPAPFWYCLFAIGAIWIAYAAIMAGLRWIRNAYRRQAIVELTQLQETMKTGKPQPQTISALLKRVALVSFPRQRVASLSGDAWLGFLTETCQQVDFTKGPETILGSASSDARATITQAELERIMLSARKWILRHHVERAE